MTTGPRAVRTSPPQARTPTLTPPDLPGPTPVSVSHLTPPPSASPHGSTHHLRRKPGGSTSPRVEEGDSPSFSPSSLTLHPPPSARLPFYRTGFSVPTGWGATVQGLAQHSPPESRTLDGVDLTPALRRGPGHGRGSPDKGTVLDPTKCGVTRHYGSPVVRTGTTRPGGGLPSRRGS